MFICTLFDLLFSLTLEKKYMNIPYYIMSFLAQLKDSKRTLKHTTTTVTQADGTRYVENGEFEIVPQTKVSGFVIDTKPDQIPALIIQNLYVGSQDCCELSVLEKYNIKNILSIGIEPFCKYSNYCYKFVECLDLPETNLIDILKLNCLSFIKRCLDEKENILVHCNAGCSRSPSIIIGFLIIELNYTFENAFELVKSKRPCIQINSGFLTQLKILSHS
ncbi:dual specificity protein phosphatase 19 [Chrysoperla carnea]|uniref:dual specificity protein phosphatase 19 n=1 Tax=Chrysoperla carnea TaxID=189513 RepID=UPI001D092573|nr:dual specificity protein phosphatase 19 [Chrysoperla carnea]